MKRIILLTLTLLLVVAIAGVVVYAVGMEGEYFAGQHEVSFFALEGVGGDAFDEVAHGVGEVEPTACDDGVVVDDVAVEGGVAGLPADDEGYFVADGVEGVVAYGTGVGYLAVEELLLYFLPYLVETLDAVGIFFFDAVGHPYL